MKTAIILVSCSIRSTKARQFMHSAARALARLSPCRGGSASGGAGALLPPHPRQRGTRPRDRPRARRQDLIIADDGCAGSRPHSPCMCCSRDRIRLKENLLYKRLTLKERILCVI